MGEKRTYRYATAMSAKANVSRTSPCLLSVKSGHWSLFDHPVGEREQFIRFMTWSPKIEPVAGSSQCQRQR